MIPFTGLKTRSLPDWQPLFDEPSEDRATSPLLTDPGQDKTRGEPPSGRFAISATISRSSAKPFPTWCWTGSWYSPRQCVQRSRSVRARARMSVSTR